MNLLIFIGISQQIQITELSAKHEEIQKMIILHGNKNCESPSIDSQLSKISDMYLTHTVRKLCLHGFSNAVRPVRMILFSITAVHAGHPQNTVRPQAAMVLIIIPIPIGKALAVVLIMFPYAFSRKDFQTQNPIRVQLSHIVLTRPDRQDRSGFYIKRTGIKRRIPDDPASARPST